MTYLLWSSLHPVSQYWVLLIFSISNVLLDESHSFSTHRSYSISWKYISNTSFQTAVQTNLNSSWLFVEITLVVPFLCNPGATGRCFSFTFYHEYTESSGYIIFWKRGIKLIHLTLIYANLVKFYPPSPKMWEIGQSFANKPSCWYFQFWRYCVKVVTLSLLSCEEYHIGAETKVNLVVNIKYVNCLQNITEI